MDEDDEFLHETHDTIETGSDELLSDDNLRLPEGANPLVRLHAVRAWMQRRQQEITLAAGTIALQLQELQQDAEAEIHMRRRAREEREAQKHALQQAFQETQQRLDAYGEAQALLEECVNHTTVGERLLVEYYLTLDNLIQEELTAYGPGEDSFALRTQVFLEVQKRIEQVGVSYEDE
jgi:regulator of protease activity HflC (stomatin/prohibitin superfamily)